MLKDPIVTAGNERLRFEGFSNCAGVYARVDVLPDGHDGEFLENGTTNVDFNAGMISALGSISKQEKVVMSVGPKEVGLYNKGEFSSCSCEDALFDDIQATAKSQESSRFE